MRFWLSLPFIGRIRIGVSVSDREIERAFRHNKQTTDEQRAIEEAVIAAKSKAFADRWSPRVAFVIWVIILWVIWRVILWLF